MTVLDKGGFLGMEHRKDRIGVIGIGSFAPFLVRGLIHSGLRPENIVIGERGHQSAALGQALGVNRADPQTIADTAATVIISTSSNSARDAIADVRWHDDSLIVSVCAGVPYSILQAVATPARVVTSLALNSCEIGASPVLLYPSDPRAALFLRRLGEVVPLDTEDQMAPAIALFCLHTWLHRLVQDAEDWGVGAKLPPNTARKIAAANLLSAAQILLHNQDRSPVEQIAALATPGGISETGLSILARENWGAPLLKALDAACTRCMSVGEEVKKFTQTKSSRQ